MSELNSLDKRIDFLLNTFHKTRDENMNYQEQLASFNQELLKRDKEIESLRFQLKEKDIELQELVIKLDRILD
jgi:chromosome segregation ATPase